MSGVRDGAAILAALGLAALLAPVAWGGERRRLAGLIALAAAWVALAATLAADSAESALDRLSRPSGAAVAGGAVVVGVVVVAAAARLVRRHPWTWFAALALALPVRFPVAVGEDDAKLLIPLYLVILVGLVAWIWARVRDEVPASAASAGALGWPLGAFLVYVLASIVWSEDGSEAAVKAVFFYIPFPVLLLLVIAWWRQGPALRALAWVTAVGGGGVAALAIGQYLARDIFWNHRLSQANTYGRFYRVNAIFYDPNLLGRFLVLGILGAVALALWSPTRRTLILAGILAAVETAALAVTFSRSSCLQLLVGLALLSVRAFGGRRVAVVGATLAILGGGIAVGGSATVRKALTDRDRLELVSEGRFDLVEGGLDIWRERPIEGVGLGSFSSYYTEQLAGRVSPGELRRTRVFVSHNTPVTVLSELGAIGFGLFALLGVWTWALLRRASRRVGGPDGWVAWTGLAMLAGILVHSLLYAGLFEDPYLWVIAGGSLAALVGVRTARREPAESPTPARPATVDAVAAETP